MKPAYRYRATVMRVCDDDTIYVDLDLGCGQHMRGVNGRGELLRLFGIEVSEVGAKERKDGFVAWTFVARAIPIGTEIVVETYLDKRGDYECLLAKVYYDVGSEIPFADSKWLCLNDILVEHGLAERVGD